MSEYSSLYEYSSIILFTFSLILRYKPVFKFFIRNSFLTSNGIFLFSSRIEESSSIIQKELFKICSLNSLVKGIPVK